MATLYAQLTEGERNQIYKFFYEEPSMSGFGGYRSIASPVSFFSSVPLYFSSVFDSCPYPSCLCLPLRTSFPRCPASSPLWREFCLWVLSRFQLPSQHCRIRLIRFLKYIYNAA